MKLFASFDLYMANILGMRSKNPNHPDYIPSIFVYCKPCTEDGLKRFHRSVARSKSRFQRNLAPVVVENDPSEQDVMEDSEAEENETEPDEHDMEDSDAEESEDEAEEGDIDGIESTDQEGSDRVEGE